MPYPTDPCAFPRPASRRGFLKRLAAAGALGAIGTRALAALPGPVTAPAPVRELRQRPRQGVVGAQRGGRKGSEQQGKKGRVQDAQH